jgi:hypothetical protein
LHPITETNSPKSPYNNLQNNKTNQKQKKPKNNFFYALETPRHQQFSHIAELGFAAFIH